MKNMGTKVRINMAYIASIVMIIGIHLPLYITSKGNHIGLVYRTNQEGLLLLLSAALAIMQRYNNRIKHLLGPIIFQIGIIVYYIIYMANDNYFVMATWGMVCQVVAVILLIISMCVGKLNDDEFTHDMSTMRIVKTDEYDYTESFILKDSVWIVAFIVITTGVILFKVNGDNKNFNNKTENVTTNSVSASEKKKTSGIFDYENDDCCIGINDAYITNEDGREIVFLEVSIKNKTDKILIFNNLFDLEVKQGDIKLERCTEVDSDVFDSKSGLAQISLLETSKVYIPFVLVKSQKDLNVSIISKKDNKSIVNNKIVKINDLYYVDTLEEIISIGEKKIAEEDNKEIKNDDKKDVEEVVDTEKTKDAMQTTEPTEKPKAVNTKEPTEKTQKAEKTEKTSEPEEVIPTEQAIENDNIVSGTVKFVKPSSWKDDTKVYIYIYDTEEEVVEKTRIIMSGYENGIYTFFLNKIDMSKDVYITFGNDTKLYPENNKKLVLAIGKKYTSN